MSGWSGRAKKKKKLGLRRTHGQNLDKKPANSAIVHVPHCNGQNWYVHNECGSSPSVGRRAASKRVNPTVGLTLVMVTLIHDIPSNLNIAIV